MQTGLNRPIVDDCGNAPELVSARQTRGLKCRYSYCEVAAATCQCPSELPSGDCHHPSRSLRPFRCGLPWRWE